MIFIKILKDELEKYGYEVYIFMIIDFNVIDFEEDVIWMFSVLFVFFKDCWVVVCGMWYVYLIVKELELDLIYIYIEFGVGILGKMVGKKMKIFVIYMYYMMYEDYLYYIVKGKVVCLLYVKFFLRVFINYMIGVVCFSECVIEKLWDYGVIVLMRIILIGIEIDKFLCFDIIEEMIVGMC